jgi:hypothetical protein
MSARGAGPEGGTSGLGFGSTRNAPIILQFRPRRKIARCSGCGGHFAQAAPRHEFCRRCYWWSIGLSAQAVAARAFRELRAGGLR